MWFMVHESWCMNHPRQSLRPINPYNILTLTPSDTYARVSCNFKVLAYHGTVFSHRPCAKKTPEASKSYFKINLWPLKITPNDLITLVMTLNITIDSFVIPKIHSPSGFCENWVYHRTWRSLKTNFCSSKLLDSDWIICHVRGLV